MVFHEGQKMDRSEYEQRLQKHREAHRPPAGAAPDTIRLNVVETGSKPFEQKRYSPGEERPGE